jgi:asparagine synthase (glutamine-hydrolysing)
MAAQFGRWNFDGAPMPSALRDRVGELLAPWRTEGQFGDCDQCAELLWFPFETTEACPGPQPMVLDSGEVLLWDGRLDNGSEIQRALGGLQLSCRSDANVVAAAWSEWGQDCLPRLVGDWALSLWIPRDRRLLLAADILATRHLFYVLEKDWVQWSSVPDPLVLLSESSFQFDEEYLAGWLGSFPAPHLTPFRAIHRVPPASVVTIRPGSVAVRRFWDIEGTRKIRYARDAEYEQHFLELLRQSVRRRLRSGSPIVAELSGGMDSSAIVCIADQHTSAAGGPQIDTVSYFSDSEPHWNERPWFARVEAQRGRAGLHIDATASLPADEHAPGILLGPGASTRQTEFLDFMRRKGSRVLLSGIGGDEFLGGVPTPVPELEDLLVTANFIDLGRRLLAWALAQRRPWIQLLCDAVIGFLPCQLASQRRLRPFLSWLDEGIVKRQRRALTGYPRRWEWFGALPSVQENVDALDGIRRQLSCKALSAGHPYERRYPYLDRDLLEFLFAIPREQLVRPRERRSLMRRALTGIVPQEILDRKRKAYVIRSPLQLAERYFRELSQETREFATAALGIVRPELLLDALRVASQGDSVSVVPLMRVVALEHWLRRLADGGLLTGSHGIDGRSCTTTTNCFPASLRPPTQTEVHL